MAIEPLLRILHSPLNPNEAEGSWQDAEATLRTKLPNDFKEFIRAYGTGTISNFLSVLNPFSTRPTFNLIEQSRVQIDALRELRDDFGETIPFELYPSKGGLLPAAISDNGDVVYWLANGDPSEWTIVVNESRSPDYQEFKCDLTTYITELLDGSQKTHAFPDIFPGKANFMVV